MNNTVLPIAAFSDPILRSVESNAVTIIVAETGAGKSTQVPQYLLAADWEVVVTQPRRLAARTLAERVAEEVGCKLGGLVGYQTAEEKYISDETRCVFVTDGLQMITELMNRTRNSGRVLVLDEVHEWNLNIEVLVAWAKRMTQDDSNFRMVIMSATMDADRLSAFFDGATIINVPGRLFPVELRKASFDVVQDIKTLVSEGRNVLVFQPGKAEILETINNLEKALNGAAVVLPLHGELNPSEQKECFAHYSIPKVVVSTNVAQTSVTIDDIDAVVDSGMERRIELVDGIEGLYLKPISLTDSLQRKGRAGRTKPGIYVDRCADPESRVEYPKAEIERVRLDQTVLRLAEIGIDMEALHFFHQPSEEAIHIARLDLKKLGCLHPDGRITKIGRKVARLPVSVSSGRMLLEADRLGVVSQVMTIAAIMETGELHIRKDREGREVHIWEDYIQGEEDSDLIAQLHLYEHAEMLNNGTSMVECGIRPGAFFRARLVRKSLEKALKYHITDVESKGSKENILKAVCSGMVNRFYSGSFNGYSNGDDTLSRRLNKDSVVRLSPFVLGLPFDIQIKGRFGSSTLNLIRMVTKINPATMMEIAPHLVEIVTGKNATYSAPIDEIISVTETRFNGVLIKSEEVIDIEHPDKTKLHVDWIYSECDRPHMYYVTMSNSFVSVPDILERIAGKHPVTGETLLLYGVYQRSGYATWVRSKDEADRIYDDTLTFLSEFHDHPKEYFKKDERKVEPTIVRHRRVVEEVVEDPERNIMSLQAKLAALQAKWS